MTLLMGWHTLSPAVGHCGHQLAQAESGAAELGRSLLRSPGRPLTIDIEKAISWFEERQRITLAPEQREAVRRVVTSKILVITGGPGTGKTHLATALGIEACGRGKKVRFWRVTELITQLMEAREERVLGRMKGQLAKLDLLILDELGYVPASKLGAELLFDVISTAYERTSLIITTNLPFERWVEVLGSERLTGATLDRLTHRCHIIESNGESYRLKDARRRREGKAPGKAGESNT